MRKGFSLVELSIVLVILGLLVGGILAGQSLIRAAELRSVTSEEQRYVTATQAFRDKYFGLPGDFKEGTRVWGRLNANADCVTNSSSAVNATTGVCDGNGDSSVDVGGAGSASGESFQFWRHLAAAGLVEGTYTGIAGSSANWDTTLGTNAPRSKLSGAGWFANTSTGVGSTLNYTTFRGNSFLFGAPVSGMHPYNPILKPEEAWNIDTKVDDGKPGTGGVIAIYWNNACGTSASNTDLTSPYNLGVSTVQCALFFVKAF